MAVDRLTGKNYDTWKFKLKAHFERDTLTNRIFLKKKYFRMQLKDGLSIESHLRAMKELTDKLAAINAPVSEEDQVAVLLGSLPDRYSTLVTALEARGDELTLQYAQQALINEEQRCAEQSGLSAAGPAAETALTAKKGRDRATFTCYGCGEPGHFRRDCPKQRKNRTSGAAHKAKHAEHVDTEEAGFVSQDPNDESPRSGWLLDSGATRHMTFSGSIFKSFSKFDRPQKVGLGDGHVLDAVGTGDVKIRIRVSRDKTKFATLHDVLHVPDLKVNLFSVRSAAERGFVVQFGHTRCWVKDNQRKVHATGTLHGKLYYLDTAGDSHVAAVASDVWHKRLGHASNQVIQRAHRENLTVGADLSGVCEGGVCEPCVKGKMTRKPFTGSNGIKTRRSLELIHSDVCGPMQNESLVGSRYLVSFIDDYTRFATVYFMREKSEVFEKFKVFEAQATNQTGHAIGTLRTDGGGEYVSREFEDYLVSKGISHQVTVRYTPEQNGVAERYNRTVVESARAMVFGADLPKRFRLNW